MPSCGAVRGRVVRGLPDHDPIWPRLPTRYRHAGRRRGGPGLLGSVRIGWPPVLARRRLVAPGAGVRDQDQRRVPAGSPGSSGSSARGERPASSRRARRSCRRSCGTPGPTTSSRGEAAPGHRPTTAPSGWACSGPPPWRAATPGCWCSGISSSGRSRRWGWSWPCWACFVRERGLPRVRFQHRAIPALVELVARRIDHAGDAGPEAPSRILFPDPGSGGSRGDRLCLESIGRR